MLVHEIPVYGVAVDPCTRCAHYETERDIVALKFACCGQYYSCHLCHEETAGHAARVWPVGQFDERAVLCGACGAQLTIWQYLACEAACPACGAAFNPGCARHRPLYFESVE